MKSTKPSSKLATIIADCIAEIGPIPHGALNVAAHHKKQSTRLGKVQCVSCGYVARVTRKWLEISGAPLCPCNSEPMEIS